MNKLWIKNLLYMVKELVNRTPIKHLADLYKIEEHKLRKLLFFIESALSKFH